MSVALVKIQIRNDTAQAWAVANPFLSDGEPGAESNTGRLKIGNGIDRWLDLPYVGGDGSGGGGTNPITGNIDGGVYTGNPRTAECGPPVQPAASMAVVEGEGQLVVSWGPASLDNPDLDTILYYVVETTTTPTDDSTYRQVGQSNTFGDPVNFAAVSEPLPTDPQNEYTYRVKAVLESGGLGEWAYTSYRHFPVPQPVEFDLVASSDTLGSTGEDNVVTISIANLTGGLDLRGPTWSYPAVTGIEGVENSEYLQLTNTAGVDTVDQAMFVSCVFYDGPQDAEFAVTRTIQINIKNTSDDPGPGPGPEPTPGDTLPLFNWETVDNAADPPPGLASKQEGLYPSTGMWPPTYQPATTPYYQSACVGSGKCNPKYPCGTGNGCNICDVDYATEWAFTDFSIIWTSPNRRVAGVNLVPDSVTQYKRLIFAGGGSCTYEPMILNVNPEDGNPELQLPNPIMNIIDEYWDDPLNQSNRRYTQFNQGYQILDRIDLNGSVASYAVLYERTSNLTQGNTSYPLSTTGAMIVTRDEGSTFQFVDVRGIGFTFTHYGGPDLPGNPNGMPKMLAKCKSATNGREVLVGLFDFEGGQDPVQQFYYTDDHVRWYPCDNRDRLGETTNKIWYDAFTDTVYATDAVRTGELDNGTYSYYKSGAGVQPRPPEAPTFNWTLLSGMPTEPPGLGNFEQRGVETGRPPFDTATGTVSNWGLDPETGEYLDLYKWPSGYFPASTFPLIDCTQSDAVDNGTNCEAFEPWMEDNEDGFAGTRYRPKVLCGLQFYIYLRLNIANLFLMYPNGQGNGESVTGDKAICYQSPAGNVTDDCDKTPIQVSVPTGSFDEREIVDLAISNPLYTQIERIQDGSPSDGSGAITLQQEAGAYQILEDVEVGGVTATYLMLTPRLIEWDDPDGNKVTEQFTGCLLVTRDSGATWEYADPKGTDTQQINPAEIDSWDITTQGPVGDKQYWYPTMLSRCWSHKYDRFVVVAMFKKIGGIQGGEEVLDIEQFYYTPDNTNWYPCNEADGNPWPLSNGFYQQPTKLWTDPATGNSYAVDPTNTGLIDENGVCSYWRSVRG